MEFLANASTILSSIPALTNLQPLPPPIVVDDHGEYLVDSLLDSRKTGRGAQYLVRWEVYAEPALG
ncbi:hypothetical protein V1504DRAFT_463538 [Lipomyces starkeyi]